MVLLHFPSTPPFPIDDGDDDDSSTDFSPLIVALIGILASVFILETNHDGWQTSSQGLDESLVKAISVCKFKKNEGLIEGTDCSVCLSEFMEDESLKLLPKCNHAFHVPCIDTWLKSHSSCPLCRANIASANQSAAVVTVQEGPRDVGVSAVVYPQRNEAISVIQDLESGVREEAVVSPGVNEDVRKTAGEEDGRDSAALEIGRDGDRIQALRRSVSMSSSLFPRGQVMSIADILHISEEDGDELQVEHHLQSSSTGIGSPKQFDASIYCCKSNQRNGVFNLAMKRSISTGRLEPPPHASLPVRGRRLSTRRFIDRLSQFGPSRRVELSRAIERATEPSR
ncbi:Detected protein of unknown function [Hibiscus syriacus]|uniref:RING-type E3 ubiquitin transferase n=1 Tax=Hibiscus syriacus TaxID=106335 RepID=A0A6A3AXV2_HIBSY|nr:Detected protein of unknown function [Hibiscus syriacus]